MIVIIKQNYRITFDIENRNTFDVYKKDGSTVFQTLKKRIIFLHSQSNNIK